MTKDLFSFKNQVEEYLCLSNRELSCFSFVNIFIWQDFFDFEFKVIDKNLCIFAKYPGGVFLYLPPLGKTISNVAIEESFVLMNAQNKSKGVGRIENVLEKELENFDPKLYQAVKKSSDIVYRKKDIIELKGNLFKSKRHDYNHFEKNYNSEFVTYEGGMFKECMALYSHWASERKAKYQDAIYQTMIDENEKVHSRALSCYKELNIVGRVVKVNGKIKAYTFGYSFNDQTFCVLFEIADLSFTGLPTFIFREFCADIELKGFELINVMDDFELGQLTQTKMSFHPSQMIPAYVISQKV